MQTVQVAFDDNALLYIWLTDIGNHAIFEDRLTKDGRKVKSGGSERYTSQLFHDEVPEWKVNYSVES